MIVHCAEAIKYKRGGHVVSEHLTLCGMEPPPRVSFADAMIHDMRQRFFDGRDADILEMQRPLRRLQKYADEVSYERYQRRLERFVNKMGVEANAVQ